MMNADENRKLMEKIQYLEATENQIFRTVLENSLYGSAIVDEEGTILYLNKYFAEIHGYNKDELIGKNLSVFHSKDQLPRVMKLNQKLINDGGYNNEEVWHVHKNGTKFPMLMTGLAISGRDGRPEYLAASAIDITERKNAEIDVIENEQRYRLLHEHSGLNVGYYKPDGTIISYNEKAANIMNGKPEDFAGKSFYDLFPKEQADEYMRRMQLAIKSNKSISYEDNVEIDDEKLWFRSTYASIKDDQNTIVGVQITSDEISCLKEQEQRLTESETRFRNMFENHNAVMLLIDPDGGKIENANIAAGKFYGYSKKEFLTLSIFDLNQLSKSEVIKKMEHAHEFKTNKFQFKHVTKDGSVKDVEVHSTPNVITGKTLLFSIINDVTEKNKSEQIRNVLFEISKVSQMDLSFRDFLEMMHRQVASIMPARNLYVSLYHKENDNYTFPYFEDETETWESDDAIAIKGSLTDYVRRLGKGQIINHLNKKELTKKNDIKLVGNESSVWLGAPLINSDNNEVIGVLAIQDYHNREAYNQSDLETLEIIANNVGTFIERIQKNEALEVARAKAEEADRLKSAFLANMSHEIRTPMNGILGFAELLKEPDITRADKESYVNIIEKSGERMLNIINDLIDISKIEAGQMEVTISETNIGEQIEYLDTFFRPEAERKGLKLISHTPPKKQKTIINTDREKVYAVVTNLLKNAIKYTPKGSIEFGFEVIEMPDNKPEVKIYVRDTGIGIPADRQKAIFERFIQADIEDKGALEGAGLGLAISSAYANMLGGKITVESEEGVGSTFSFTIPDLITGFSDVPDENKAITNNKKEDMKKLKVLIVEDDEFSLFHLKTLMRNLAVEILTEISGFKAVEACRARPDIDLILMDIKLPDMDGYTATREIRKFNTDIFIIAQTAYALAGDREKALESGCNEYLSKPVKKQDLMNIISGYLASNQ